MIILGLVESLLMLVIIIIREAMIVIVILYRGVQEGALIGPPLCHEMEASRTDEEINSSLTRKCNSVPCNKAFRHVETLFIQGNIFVLNKKNLLV